MAPCMAFRWRSGVPAEASIGYALAMRKTDLAWAAGLIDGEGCICLIRHPAKQFKGAVSERYHLVLRVSMCHKVTVDRIHGLFSIGSRSVYTPKTSARVSESYAWTCNSRQAEIVLKLIRPYLVTKAVEADLALEYLALPTPPRGGRGGGSPIPSDIQRKRYDLYLRLRMQKTRNRYIDLK